METILEVCVDSVESAIAAAEGGADRLELCENLIIGGTTPGRSLLRAVKAETGLPVHVLLRPRFGDFLYTEREFALMLEDGRVLLDCGADALVSGCLTAEGDLDMARMEALVTLAKEAGKGFTLHRAFDMCREPLKALEECRMLGVDTILTSGQKNHCLQGLALLETLHREAGDVRIMVGAGVDGSAIRQVRRKIPQATCFHMSGKVTLDSAMEFRRADVSMGLPGFSEYALYRTSREKIMEARTALTEA